MKRSPRSAFISRVVIAALTSLLVIGGVAPPAAIAADSGPVDITSSPEGARILRSFTTSVLGDLSKSAAASTQDSYRVIRNVANDPSALWVVPAGAALPTVSVSATGFSMTTTATPVSEPIRSAKSAPDAGASVASAGISWQSPYCYARYQEVNGWFDHCRQFGKISYDGDSSRDHWVLKQYGTCKSGADWSLSVCKLSSKKAGSITQYWEDWAPKSDTDGSCRSLNASVSAGPVSVPLTYTGCEVNDIFKGSAPGSFIATWKYPWGLHLSERAVKSQISVGVPNGTSPSFTLTWDVSGMLWM